MQETDEGEQVRSIPDITESCRRWDCSMHHRAEWTPEGELKRVWQEER